MFGLGEGINVSGQIGSDIFQYYQNRKAQDREMDEAQKARNYDRQAYHEQNQFNIDQWNRENLYNSPTAQMARFKEAGLNPHLIYGKGTSGNASQPQSAAEIKPYSKPKIKSLGEGLKGFPNIGNPFQTSAQIDNLAAQTAVAQQQAALVSAQTLGTVTATIEQKRATKQSSTLDPFNAQAAEANSIKAIKDATTATQAANIGQATQSLVIKKIGSQLNNLNQDILNKKQQLSNDTIRGRILKLEESLNIQGVQKGDNIIPRIIIQQGSQKWNALKNWIESMENPYQ